MIMQKIALIYIGNYWPSSAGLANVKNKYIKYVLNIGDQKEIATIRNRDCTKKYCQK
jgi:hypothetical protein